MVGLIDIDNRISIDVSTVPRILNRTPNIIKVTKKSRSMVLNIATELGYATAGSDSLSYRIIF